jgi:hypothetical protein
MSKRQDHKTTQRARMAALLAGAVCLSLTVVTQPLARPDHAFLADPVRFAGAEAMAESPRGMVGAVKQFVSAMAEGDAKELWMFASEEEHDAFQTEPAAYAAYALDFPVLTRAKETTFVRAWQEGDTPYVEMLLRDVQDDTYWAELGLWLDDAGDWKIASHDIKPTSEFVAGL